MKAIIPVAGAGTKLRPHTYSQHKALIPLAGKPILYYVIKQVKDAGVKDFIFIIGHLGDKIQNYVENNFKDINSVFISQTNRKGTAQAIGLAKEMVAGDQVIINYGDTIVEMDFKEVISKSGNQIGAGRVDNPSDFGIVEVDDSSDLVTKFIEKPKFPHSNLAMIGVYKIADTEDMFDRIHEINFDDEEDVELPFTEALEKMREKGGEFHTFSVDRWYDCGKKENILSTNKIMLQKLEDQNQLPKLNFKDSIIFQPTIVGEKTIIENSIIGPYTSIGDNVIIRNCIIRDSIIGAYSELDKTVLENSLIGNDVIIKGNKHELNIGDNTEIDLS